MQAGGRPYIYSSRNQPPRHLNASLLLHVGDVTATVMFDKKNHVTVTYGAVLEARNGLAGVARGDQQKYAHEWSCVLSPSKSLKYIKHESLYYSMCDLSIMAVGLVIRVLIRKPQNS